MIERIKLGLFAALKRSHASCLCRSQSRSVKVGDVRQTLIVSIYPSLDFHWSHLPEPSLHFSAGCNNLTEIQVHPPHTPLKKSIYSGYNSGEE